MGQAPLIQRVQRNDRLPLSFGQERLWFVEQLTPGSSLYNEPLVVLELNGPLQISCVQAAIDHLVVRHEPLRSYVVQQAGQLSVRVRPPQSVPIVRVTLDTSERAEALDTWLNHEALRPFDLENGPLFRAALIDFADNKERHCLVLGLHHMVSDGWSVRLLLNEIAAMYAAANRGHSLPGAFPELEIQYGDYAAWQKNTYRNGGFADEQAYWLQCLVGAPTTQWVADHPGQAKGFVANFVADVIPLELLDGIRRAAENNEFSANNDAVTTRYMILLACWLVVLQARANTSDLTVATAVAGRSLPELEGLIGFFVNVMLLRVDTCGNPPFRELLARVRTTVVGALSHQALPFDCLVQQLQPERLEGRQPLTNVFFAYHNFPHTEIDIDELKVSRYRHERGGAKYDISLLAVEKEENTESLSLQLWYDEELYDERSMRVALRALRHIIEALNEHGIERRLLLVGADNMNYLEDSPW
ncbi:hypothetical protein CDH05_07005 [Pseudomonas lactis]|nr:hypothetical protein CDH05_07005 [Pseudomonas lactis]